MSARVLADRLAEALAPYLGAFNARVMVKTIAQKSAGVAPEALGPEHLPALFDALAPTLCTFVGRTSAEALLDEIRREVA
jgi:hypothetical protein